MIGLRNKPKIWDDAHRKQEKYLNNIKEREESVWKIHTYERKEKNN